MKFGRNGTDRYSNVQVCQNALNKSDMTYISEKVTGNENNLVDSMSILLRHLQSDISGTSKCMFVKNINQVFQRPVGREILKFVQKPKREFT